jgi:hypothetical protein
MLVRSVTLVADAMFCNRADPYKYVRTGSYASILANEAANSGKLAKPIWWKAEQEAAAQRAAAKRDNARGYKGKPITYW